MVTFSKRLLLEKKFEEWAEKNGVKKCPESMVTFLDTHGLLHADEVLNFILQEVEEQWAPD